MSLQIELRRARTRYLQAANVKWACRNEEKMKVCQTQLNALVFIMWSNWIFFRGCCASGVQSTVQSKHVQWCLQRSEKLEWSDMWVWRTNKTNSSNHYISNSWISYQCHWEITAAKFSSVDWLKCLSTCSWTAKAIHWVLHWIVSCLITIDNTCIGAADVRFNFLVVWPWYCSMYLIVVATLSSGLVRNTSYWTSSNVSKSYGMY